MESLLVRYRNITLLLLVVFAQVILLAVQVKNKSDMRMIRVWSVTAVTIRSRRWWRIRGALSRPSSGTTFLSKIRGKRRGGQHAEIDTLKLQNQELRSESGDGGSREGSQQI